MFKALKGLYAQLTFKNLEPMLIEAHRGHLIYRSRITMLLCATLMPLTGLPYFFLTHRETFLISILMILSIGSGGSLLLWSGIKRGLFNKFYHLPTFLLTTIIVGLPASILFPFAGGGKGTFVFPYFLLYFGVAALLPCRLPWVASSLGLMPFYYFFTEWIRNVPLNAEFVVSNLIFLSIGAMLAIAGNQVILSIFFEEKRNQFKLEAEKEKLLKITSQLAHDLRSPLTSLRAAITLLKEPNPSGGSGKDFLNLLELSSNRFDSIANEVLEQHGAKRSGKVAFSLHRVLDELIGEYSEGRNGIRFVKDYGEVTTLVGNRDRLQRAFGNILKNAIEAMPRGGELTLKTLLENGQAVVSISDTGVGISPENLAKVLKGGYSKGKKEGHGIGMSVVREVVEEFKGLIASESTPGKGTTFRIKLSLPDSTLLKESDQVEEGGAGLFELRVVPKEQVVVIDDDPAAQIQWELTLRKLGLEPLSYDSYEDFQKEAAERPALRTAIVDYHFDNSELDGLQIIERLKRSGFNNLTLCTGEYWKPVVREQAKKSGIPICPKPIPKVVVQLRASSQEVRR